MTDYFEPYTQGFEPISLAGLNASAALLDRSEHKYLFEIDQFLPLLETLREHYYILEIDGKRMFRYESLYFDTDKLAGYTFHNQGRTKRRFKVRTRHYVDSGLCYFEVKLKDKRGGTIKKRITYPVSDYATLTAQAEKFFASWFHKIYGLVFTEQLMPRLHVNYDRITLVAKTGGERMTIDFNLLFSDGNQPSAIKPMIIVETKSPDGRGIADAIFRSQGIRSRSCSKYCLGLNLLDFGVKYNRFKPLLKLYDSLPTYQPSPIPRVAITNRRRIGRPKLLGIGNPYPRKRSNGRMLVPINAPE